MRTNKITNKDIQEFIKKALWESRQANKNSLDNASNYIGEDLSGWLTGPTRSRDSDNMTESNFTAALEMLGGERAGIVEVHRFGHWGCGWFEQIMINSKNKRAVKTLLEIHRALEDHCLLDDSDYSEREDEDRLDTAAHSTDDARALLEKLTDLPELLLNDESLLKDFAYEVISEIDAYCGEKYFDEKRITKIAQGLDYACGSNLDELQQHNNLTRTR